MPAYVKIQYLGGNRKSSSLLFAAVLCNQSTAHTKARLCAPLYCPSGQLVFHLLPPARLHFFVHIKHFHDQVVWKVQGAQLRERKSSWRRKNRQILRLSSMTWLTAGLKRHQAGQSSRIASFQAAGQHIHPGAAPPGWAQAALLPISSDNCISNKWD